jgi:prepilin-type N-terminal cleavage/methylation domain-containing protein
MNSPRAGFTLIEVIVTLTIFILLTASVFGIMTAVFQTSNNLQANQNRRDEVSALCAFLKNNFANLAAADHLVTYTRGTGDGLSVNGIILVTRGMTEAIDATPQPNGLYLLRLGRPDGGDTPTLDSFEQEVEKNENALAWTTLVGDVRSVGWKFQSSSSPDWENEWTADPVKPTLIEFSVALAGDDLPTTMDVLIPHLVPPSAILPVATNGP